MKDTNTAKQRGIALALAGIAAVAAAGAAWTLYRPAGAAEVSLAPAAPVRADAPFLLDLNAASEEELVCLPGVGPALAESILARRGELGAFRTREDILSVSGIGEATYEKIAPYITY